MVWHLAHQVMLSLLFHSLGPRFPHSLSSHVGRCYHAPIPSLVPHFPCSLFTHFPFTGVPVSTLLSHQTSVPVISVNCQFLGFFQFTGTVLSLNVLGSEWNILQCYVISIKKFLKCVGGNNRKKHLIVQKISQYGTKVPTMLELTFTAINFLHSKNKLIL